MLGKIISLAVIVIGALICYGARLISKKVLKRTDPDDKTLAQIKLAGLGVAVAGMILLFIIGGVRI